MTNTTRELASSDDAIRRRTKLHMLLIALSTLALQLPSNVGRREVVVGAVASFSPLAASAYDTLPTQTADFDAMEKARLAREAAAKKNKAEVKPYLKAISVSSTGQEFSDATDSFSLWLIGKGKLPDGIDAPAVRDIIQDTYQALPQRAYACEMTRTNKGICYSPGEPADGAYSAAITQLRKYATRKGKGSLMSDGVSAANSAAF